MTQGKRSPKAEWGIADVVDLEFFLDDDERLRRDSKGEEQLDQRDREIYIDHIEAADSWRDSPRNDSSERRRLIFGRWLEARRSLAMGDGSRPGELFESFKALAGGILVVLGALCGFLDASAASYFGRLQLDNGLPEPANVQLYLVICVVVPAVLVVAAMVSLRRLSQRDSKQAVLFNFLAGAVSNLVTWLMIHVSGLDSQAREHMRATSAGIIARLKEHRTVMKWPFFLMFQKFGIAFATAVTLTTLILNLFSDRGFGWQTSATNLFVPARIEGTVWFFSLPWRWMPFHWATQPDANAIACSQVVHWPTHSDSALFSLLNIKNSPGLANKLRDKSNEVSQFLMNQFSADGRRLLDDSNPAKDKLQDVLIGELNNVLKGPSLYGEQGFAEMQKSREAVALQARNPRGDEIFRLNRLLLEDAYPEDLTRDAYVNGRLSNDALKAWWPFLVMFTVIYGILPRMLLFGLARCGQRNALLTLPLDDTRCERLFRRLIKPGLAPPPIIGPPKPPPPGPKGAPLTFESGDCLLLASFDLREVAEKDSTLLADLLAHRCGWRARRTLLFGQSARKDRELIETLRTLSWKDGRPRLLCLQDASFPPIGEIRDFLRECRDALGEHGQVTIGLIGTPGPTSRVPVPRPAEVAVWQRKIEAMADPRIGVIRLAQ